MTKPFDAEAMAREIVQPLKIASKIGANWFDEVVAAIAAALQRQHDAHEAELELVWAGYALWEKKHKAAQAENEELRKALEQLLFEDSDTPENAYLRHRLEARAALASKEPTDD